MRKALFLRPFRIVEWRKGLVCSSVGRPMSPNTRDPISELSKKSEIGVTKNEKWQEECNYRRIYNEAGEVIANIITVDGVDVEVAEDVYLAYSQADRRERYVREEQFSGKILSLEQMAEDDLLSDYVGAEAAPSAEEEALEREQAQSLAERKEMLLLAMLSLNNADRELINALFFDGVSTRDYAARIGITQRAVIKRRDRILRDLKKCFENFSN